jgi:hypothetical protein
LIVDTWAADFLTHEAHALLTRLDRVTPFALTEVMVPAANVPRPAQLAIERYLAIGRQELRGRVGAYRRWLLSSQGRRADVAEAQRRFTVLRMRFNRVLTQFDLFADVLSQRSERDNGVWLSGLDVLAADALALPGYYESPAVVCYLDRGVGAAIRRARTRLPGGGENPVAIIRVPRERMVGSGVASSLVHEVGHQAAALLGLVDSLRAVLRFRIEQASAPEQAVWRCFERWISEIVADFWSVARVGVTSTMGLIGVVSLPRAFVFRISLADPHPFPWIRVKLSCAMGRALYPHPQWDRLSALWEGFYPKDGLDPGTQSLVRDLEAGLPELVDLLVSHQPESLGGEALADVMDVEGRLPRRLHGYYQRWLTTPSEMYDTPPTLVFAVLGQQRADGGMGPDEESETLAKLLVHWALHGALGTDNSRSAPERGAILSRVPQLLT